MSPGRLDLSGEARLDDGGDAPSKVAPSKRPASGGDVFCVCRKPDNHRWMIACDGGCNDWYHGDCVKVSEQEGRLIDKYICPSCERHGKRTSWRRMCRLIGCGRPARVGPGVSERSKYCSDDHGVQFWRHHLASAAEPNQRSGADARRVTSDSTASASISVNLSANTLATLTACVETAVAFRGLGQSIPTPVLPRQDDDDHDEIASTGSAADNYRRRRQHIHDARARLTGRQRLLRNRAAFVKMVCDTAKALPRDGCAFDERLSWSDERFETWLTAEDGQAILAGSTAGAASTGLSNNGNVTISDTVCQRRRCERHRQWDTLHLQELGHEQAQLRAQFAQLDVSEKELERQEYIRQATEASNRDGAEGSVEVVAVL